MVFENLLDPILSPLLAMPSFWAILLIAGFITLAITLVYKYTTNQEHMRKLKAKVKTYQEKMKKLRDQPEKMMKVQKEAMSVNMELMKHSFRPTLYTFIPIIIIFGWLNAHMAFYNLAPGQQFSLHATFSEGVPNATLSVLPEGVTLLSNATLPVENGSATWTLQGDPGTYKAIIDAGGDSVEKTFLLTAERRYEPPSKKYGGSPVTSVTLSNKVIKPLGDISLFGWHPGWLGTYILLSILLSTLFRKLLKVV